MTAPREVWDLPHRHVGRRVHCFDSVASTSDIAVPPGEAVLADVQTAGRGQHGRSWLARPGDAVLLSVTLDPPPELRRPALLTGWAAAGVCETVAALTGASPAIKWPNDVMLEGRKVCGVLIEQSRHVVAGIGLNVNQSRAEFDAANLTATSLALAAGRAFDPPAVARELLTALDRLYHLLLNGMIGEVEERWRSRLGLVNRAVIAESFDGTRRRGILTGCEFAGLTIDGERLAPETIRALSAG